MGERMRSRKFWVVVCGCVTAVGAVLSGAMPADEAAKAITAIIMTYLGAQGVADAAGAMRQR